MANLYTKVQKWFKSLFTVSITAGGEVNTTLKGSAEIYCIVNTPKKKLKIKKVQQEKVVRQVAIVRQVAKKKQIVEQSEWEYCDSAWIAAVTVTSIKKFTSKFYQ